MPDTAFTVTAPDGAATVAPLPTSAFTEACAVAVRVALLIASRPEKVLCSAMARVTLAPRNAAPSKLCHASIVTFAPLLFTDPVPTTAVRTSDSSVAVIVPKLAETKPESDSARYTATAAVRTSLRITMAPEAVSTPPTSARAVVATPEDCVPSVAPASRPPPTARPSVRAVAVTNVRTFADASTPESPLNSAVTLPALVA